MGTPGLTPKSRETQKARLSEPRSQINAALSAYELWVRADKRMLFESAVADTQKLVEACSRFQDSAAAGKYEEACSSQKKAARDRRRFRR